MALQHLYQEGVLHTRLRVGAITDPAEARAERVARAVTADGPAGEPPCAHCNTATHSGRPAAPGRATPAHAERLGLGPGQPIDPSERAVIEARLGMDLSAVRIHDNPAAATAAAQLDARAFSIGSDVAFAAGEYRPRTGEGRRLLAHELAHVAESAERDEETLRRQPLTGPATGVEPAPVPVTDPEAAVAARVQSFKELVKITAIHRLIGNQNNLGHWSVHVDDAIPDQDLAALGLAQGGGAWPYFALQDIQDPGLRELRAEQAFGRKRACTGCHVENQLWGTRQERERESLTGWATPAEQRAGIGPRSGALAAYGLDPGSVRALGGPSDSSPPVAAPVHTPPAGIYRPTPGTAEARLHQLFPDPTATGQALARIQPILQALGDEGYKVLPGSMLAGLENGTPQELRERIQGAIRQRRSDYEALIAKIRAGELGYEHFGPIIRDLLPLADSEVRAAIQKEMDDHAFWSKVELVVVGILTIAALIALVFPPTTALGVVALGALDVTLGAYGVVKGEEMMRVGSAYRLATGAHDVLTPGQQAAGDGMVLAGFVSVAIGIFGIRGGAARVEAGLSRLGSTAEAGNALAVGTASSAARTVQQGEYLITIGADGTLYATVASRPDLLLVLRGNTATLYQILEGGGMRVAGTTTLTRPAAGVTPMLPGGSAEGALPGAAMAPSGPAAPPAPVGPWLLPTGPRPPFLLPERSPGTAIPPWSLSRAEPAPFILPSRAPAPGQAPVYQLPVGPQGQGGVMLMNRGLTPADFGMKTIAQDAALLRLWDDALSGAASTGQANAYTRWLDAVADGSVANWSSKQLGNAFDVVNSRFMEAARTQGIDLATVHHWNFPKSLYPRSIVDPHHLVPVEGQASLRGTSWHPVHQGGLHPLTTGSPSRPTAGPVAPAHILPLNLDFPGMPAGWHPPMLPPVP
jgi:hypothetical protein